MHGEDQFVRDGKRRLYLAMGNPKNNFFMCSQVDTAINKLFVRRNHSLAPDVVMCLVAIRML